MKVIVFSKDIIIKAILNKINNSKFTTIIRYTIYHLRWQLSGIVMIPVLKYCAGLSIELSVIIAQFVGACIFWFIDKKIFKNV